MVDLIILGALAAFIGFRLYSTLGKKVEIERKEEKQGQVVKLPQPKPRAKAPATESHDDALKPSAARVQRKKAVAPQLSAKLNEGLQQVVKLDSSFTIDDFTSGAKSAFEMIFEAFASGDKSTLQGLLSAHLYSDFAKEIDRRAETPEIEESTLVALNDAVITDITTRGSTAKVKVEFISEQISLVKDKEGKILEGDPSQVDNVREIWTFERNMRSSDPNWALIEIQS
jgi:predicted lipid-binding transport protein (Tim44 family)